MLRAILLLCLALVATAQTTKEQLILQAQELLQQGNLSGARQFITQAQKTYPNEAGFDNLRGIIAAQENNYPAAEAAFQRAVTRSPKFTGAYLNLGRLYQENSDNDPEAIDKARQTYQRVLQYQPHHTEANYQTAVLWQMQGNFKTSLLHLSRLPAEYQQRAQILAVQCADYAGLGESAKADEGTALLLAHAELLEADVLAVLPALIKAQRHEFAVKLLSGLAQRNLASAAAFYQLGLAYERTGALSQARTTLEKAASADRPSPKLLFDLARVAHQQKDLPGALGYLAHARDLAPQEAVVHYYFGQLCAEMNLVAEAHKALREAVKLEPHNAAFNYAMGVVSTWRHDVSEAIPYFQKYTQLVPTDPRGQLALGATYFKSKDYEAARQALTKASKNKVTAHEAHYYLGRLARQENKLEVALHELTLTLTAWPQHVDALAELGWCQMLRKDYAAAQQTLARALQIDGDHYAANYNLLVLYSRTKDARAAEQAKRFEEVKQRREERTQDMLRMIETKPVNAN